MSGTMNVRVPLLALLLLGAALGWAWPQDLGPWRSLGLLAGWAGTALVVTSTLLVVREARVARLLGGVEAMLRGHHVTGVIGYACLLLHPLALALDAALLQPSDGLALLDPRGQSGPVLLGWVALLLLMVGLGSSFRIGLGYRRWRAWHHTLAAGALLGLLHIDRLLGDPLVLWALAGLAGAALLLRYVAIDRGLLALPFRVDAVSSPAPQVVEATLSPLAATLSVQPGQFVLLALGDGPGFHGCGEFHPFSVSGLAPGGTLKVAIKSLGPCSARAQQLSVGTTVRVQGPFGQFLSGPPQGPQLWVAGGIGITPFMAALRAAGPTQPTTLIHLVQDERLAPFGDELRELAAAHPRLQLLTRSSRDAASDLPALLDQVDGLAHRQVRACGPPPLLQALRQALAVRGVTPDLVQSERFEFR